MAAMRAFRITLVLATLTLIGGACTRSKEGERAEEMRTIVAQQHGAGDRTTAAPLSEVDATKLAVNAYVYGYAPVTMEMTRRVMTNVAAPEGPRAPMGQFAHLRTYPTPNDRDVTAPNADTLYSVAWIDLAKEPYVLSIPDAGDRYYLMPMLDGYTNVFQDPGSRTTGTKAQRFAITGPSWQGQLPAGITEYKSPTNLVWILGRTYCSGTPADYAAVHAFQDKLSLVPLSALGKAYKPPPGKVDPTVDMKTPVRDQVNRMNGMTFFSTLSAFFKNSPPVSADGPLIDKLPRIGLVPGGDFELSKLDPAVVRALSAAPAAGQEAIMAQAKNAGHDVNGWLFSTRTGTYGTDYLQRAFITAVGLGANRPEDAIYPTSETDADKKPYDGANKYVIHFPRGQTPPVKGFWSVTMYDPGFFFVDNPIHRYSISPRTLKPNADGSVDIYVQKDSPRAGRESNWLPAPAGKFKLMLRLYWPEQPILSGTWQPPAVRIASKP